MRLLLLTLVLTFSTADSTQSPSVDAITNQTSQESSTDQSDNTKINSENDLTVSNQNSLTDPKPSSLFGGHLAYSSSTSRELENGIPKFDAKNALTRGSNYWKSEDNLTDKDEVTFIVEFKVPKMVGGTDIEWVNPPITYSISCSFGKKAGNDHWETIASTLNGESSYTKFTDFFRCKKIKFDMIPNDYIAIRSIRFVGEPDVLFRIQSGITSVQDMCLQVDQTGELILSSCLIPIAMNSGLDIFKFNSNGQLYSPIVNKCIVVKSENNIDSVVMDNCDEYLNKGGSIWFLTPQNQLSVDKSGEFCLSQRGSKAGYTDVAMSKLVSSSDESEGYPPYNAVDGNPTTKWQSREFPTAKPSLVTLTLDLMEVYKIERIEILWDSPPLTYEILYADGEDKNNFKQIIEVKSNILSHTYNQIGGIRCQVVKIVMKNGLAEPSHLPYSNYGIRSISILANRLTTIVEECSIAKKSSDTRDKYFFESVHQLDLHNLSNVRSKLNLLIGNIESLVSKLEQLPIDICKRDIVQKSEKIKFLEREFESITQKLDKLHYATPIKSTILGISSDNPGRDCMEIKNYNPKNPSGFYYIKPECTTNPIRVYCDMKMGLTYLDKPIDDTISVENSIKMCKAMGLDIVRIYDPAQIIAIQHMLQMINAEPDALYPLAFITAGRLKSLDLKTDSSDALDGTKFLENDNTIVVSRNSITGIDATTKEMTGVICSFNAPPMKPLDCITTMKSFNHALGSEYLFSCPHNCLEELPKKFTLIGGFESTKSNNHNRNKVFTLDTPICLAAVTTGNRYIKAKIVEAPEKFEGFVSNGVVVESGESKRGDFAVALLDPCTIEKSVTVTSKTPPKTKTSNKTHITVMDDYEKDPSTLLEIGSLVRIFEKSIQEFSDSFINLLSTHVNHILHNTKSVLMPSLFAYQRNDKNLIVLEKNFTKIQYKLDLATTFLVNRVKESYDQYKTAKQRYNKHQSYLSWSINQLKNFNLEFGYLGIGVWDVNDQVIQYSNEANSHGVHNLCVMRDRNLFDFIYVANIKFTGNGSAGLVFRFQNPTNYYLLELVQNMDAVGEKYKRLVRVQDGIAHELARFVNINVQAPEKNDSEDLTIRIEARRERLGVSFLKSVNDLYSTPPFDINVIDDGLLSGTFGFMTSLLPKVTFSNVNIEALNCINNIYTPPIPQTCTSYNVDDIITDDWISIPPGEIKVSLTPAISDKLMNNSRDLYNSGRLKSLIMRDMGDFRYYLLGKKKSCLYGDFHFNMFLQCNKGYAGAVVRFSNANNYIAFLTSTNDSKLVQVTDGISHDLSTSSSGIKVGRWYRVKISMTKSYDEVFIGVYMDEVSTIDVSPAKTNILSRSTSILSKNSNQIFTVGLTNRGCAAVAFTNISLERNASVDSTRTGINPSPPSSKISKEGANLLSICREHSTRACNGDVECCRTCCITAQGYSSRAGNECEYACMHGITKSQGENKFNQAKLYNKTEL